MHTYGTNQWWADVHYRALINVRDVVLRMVQKNRPDLVDRLDEAYALVLGSGLGAVADAVQDPVVVPYELVPGMPQSFAPGHAGCFVIGTLGASQKPVICMQGRVHLYEGYSPYEVVFGVRLMRLLGAHTLIVTNAAGGINTSFKVGDVMLMSDHINLLGVNPLTGFNIDKLGLRFPDMTTTYTPALRELARSLAPDAGVSLQEGVYLAAAGPTFETPAEIVAYRALGADTVGMSTVPEVIAARHMGMRILGFSMVTNMAAGIADHALTSEDVTNTGDRFASSLATLIKMVIEVDDGRSAYA